MRASEHSSSDDSDEIRGRYLGEIAPLLDASRQIDSLSEVQKKQVRKRIVRTLFRTRSLSLRVRLVPVLAALGLLVIGGAAFATAERLGLIPRMGAKSPSAPTLQPKQTIQKHRNMWPAVRAQGPGSPEAAFNEDERDESGESALAVSDASSVVLPEVPDPLLFPVAPASTSGWSLLPTSEAPRAIAVAETHAKPLRRPAKPMAYVEAAPVMSSPSSDYAGHGVARETPAPVQPTFAPAQPVMAGPPPAAAMPFLPAAQAAAAAPVPPAAAAVKPVAAPRVALSDQALFGQAMRKLRMENDPSAALSALQEHAKVYPRSSLGGERSALEVEALLALHRDRDALARLDTMALDDLPRSGERFVVRGELRAAARRWLEASADFDHALSRVTGSPAWHERALWGRGAARLRSGERAAGMADLERYLDKYPSGRFAAEAAKFFPNR